MHSTPSSPEWTAFDYTITIALGGLLTCTICSWVWALVMT
jgi:hypothetical protein